MKAVGRIQKARSALGFISVSVDVVEFATRGGISRGIVSGLKRLGDPTRGHPKQPTMIKVESERRPLQ